MKKHTIKQLKTLMKQWGLSYEEYVDPVYIMDEAVEAGATISLSVRDRMDFAFNAQGELLGTFTDRIGSWKPVEGE